MDSANKDIIQIQKGYLGHLFTRLCKEDVEKMDILFRRKIKTRYFRGSNHYLKKIACYFLLSKGKWLEYRYVSASEILGCWLGKDVVGEGNQFHLDFKTPLMLLHNVAYNAPNKALEPLLCQQVAERSNRQLPTIVLDEGNLCDLRDAMEKLGLYVHETNVDRIFESEVDKPAMNSLDKSIL